MKEPLGVFFADYGETLTFGSFSKPVLFEGGSVQGIDGFMQSQSHPITYNPLDFPGLGNGDQVEFRTKAWRVENVAPDGDGALWLADLVQL